MPPLLPRFTASKQHVEDERKIGRILLESEVLDDPATVARATLPGARGVFAVCPAYAEAELFLERVRTPPCFVRSAGDLGASYQPAEVELLGWV